MKLIHIVSGLLAFTAFSACGSFDTTETPKATVSTIASTPLSTADLYDQVLVPFFFNVGKRGSWQTASGTQIVYHVFEQPADKERGAIVFVPGVTDSSLKFVETLYEIYNQGYSVYAIDNRGNGFSDHLVESYQQCVAAGTTFGKGCKSDLVHIDSFDDYVTDLHYFVSNVVNAKPHKVKLLSGMSMGGGISGLYLERYPDEFQAATLFVPMFEINTGDWNSLLAWAYTWFNTVTGKGKDPAPNSKPFGADTVDTQTGTHDKERWLAVDKIVVARPEIAQASETMSWVKSSLEATKTLRENAHKIKTPLLIVQSEKDDYVLPGGHAEVCKKAANCEIFHQPNTFHGVLHESDEARTPIMKKAFAHFAKYAPTAE